MEEIEMYDAFQPPAPSQTTLDWLSTGSMHELAPRIGVVQWQPSETNCSALNSLRREIMLIDQSAPRPSTSSHVLKENTFMSFGSTSSSRVSASSASSSTSTRRKLDRFSRVRRSNAPREPTSSMKEAVPELANLIKSVVSSIDDQAQLKQHHVEKKRRQALAERSASSSRVITRTSSARQAVPVKKQQPLSRRMSEDVLDSKGKSAARSRAKDSLADMEWVPSLSPPKMQTECDRVDSSLEDPFSTEANRSVELPHDTLLVTEETMPKLRKLLATQDLMPPPPKPVKPQARPPQPKPVHEPVSHDRFEVCTPPQNVYSSQSLAKAPKPPTSSQSHRPPALGMRRANPYGPSSSSSSTTLPSSQTLPNKQRGFKTPFARPSVPSAMTKESTDAPAYRTSNLSADSTPSPVPGRVASARTRSPSPVLDPDSSYGEISFDMDIVEETMKQYDEV